ncbi:MAG: cold shock domain-containing protein [Thermodesulfobacteriota bacterium]
MEGVIKWFDNAKGYGFISVEGWPNVFLHVHEIQTDRSRPLAEGERVQFDVMQTRRGLKAVNVDRVGRA